MLPVAVKLSTISNDWLEYAKKFANELENTSEVALSQRTEKNIYGTDIEDYSSLIAYYNQRYFTDLKLPEEISRIEEVHHLRFGVLEPNATIPFHLDEPYNLRFICLIQGSHIFYTENNLSYEMVPGELWYINGSFKHSVKNTSTDIRIALLGKFPPTVENLRLINELL
jgi:hypothetical protein